MQWAVPDLVPEGFSILAASPKIGKSFMVLHLALECVSGGHAFGVIPVDPRPVVYLALEDGQRGLRDRIKRIGAHVSEDALEHIDFKTEIHPQKPARLVIREFLDKYKADAPLVVLDTLGKARPPKIGSRMSYDDDLRETGGYADLTHEYPGSSLIAVHHTNKGQHEDPFDGVSGTQGIVGGADTVLRLSRRRNSGGVTMHVTGRELEEHHYAFNFAQNLWRLDGSDLEEASRLAGVQNDADRLSENSRKILDMLVKFPDGLPTADVVRMSGMPRSEVDVILSRQVQAGRLLRPRRGLYAVVQK